MIVSIIIFTILIIIVVELCTFAYKRSNRRSSATVVVEEVKPIEQPPPEHFLVHLTFTNVAGEVVVAFDRSSNTVVGALADELREITNPPPMLKSILVYNDTVLEETATLDEVVRTAGGSRSLTISVTQRTRMLGAITIDTSFDAVRWDLHSKSNNGLMYSRVPLRELSRHNSAMFWMELDQTGNRWLVGGLRDVLCWDLRLGSPGSVVARLSGHTAPVLCGTVSWSENRCITGSSDRTIRMWDLGTYSSTHTLRGHSTEVNCVSADWMMNRCVSGDLGHAIIYWNLGTSEIVFRWTAHYDEVLCIALRPGHDEALSGGSDLLLRLWQVPTGKLLRELKGHSRGVKYCSVKWDHPQQALSASNEAADRGIRLWDLETGDCLHEFNGHYHCIRCISVYWQARRFVSVDGYGLIIHWDLETGSPVSTFFKSKHTASCIACFEL